MQTIQAPIAHISPEDRKVLSQIRKDLAGRGIDSSRLTDAQIIAALGEAIAECQRAKFRVIG